MPITMQDPPSPRHRAQLRREREELKARHAEFFAQVAALMFTHDPIGISFVDNTDEYEPEAGTVIPRLASCKTSADVAVVLHQEFCRWFGPEIAGPSRNYEALAEDIWRQAVAFDWQGLGGAP